MLSLFSVTLAVSKTVAWFDTGDKKQLFSALLCLVVSVEIYQTHLAIYIIALGADYNVLFKICPLVCS